MAAMQKAPHASCSGMENRFCTWDGTTPSRSAHLPFRIHYPAHAQCIIMLTSPKTLTALQTSDLLAPFVMPTSPVVAATTIVMTGHSCMLFDLSAITIKQHIVGTDFCVSGIASYFVLSMALHSVNELLQTSRRHRAQLTEY